MISSRFVTRFVLPAGASLVLGLTITADPTATVTTVTLAYDVRQANMWPVWSGGALIAVEGNRTAAPVVRAFNRNGQQISAITLGIPESDRIALKGIGLGLDGSTAFGGISWTPSGTEAAFIALVSSDGKSQQIVRTSPYTPFGFTVSSDGTIWTVGAENVGRSEKSPQVNPANGVIRHFDSTGRLMAAFIPRSSLGPSIAGLSSPIVSAAGGRFGWYWAVRNQYTEVSSAGVVQSFQGLPQGEITNLALTDNGGTFISVQSVPGSSYRLYSLDHSSGTWVPLTDPPGSVWHWLYGADGNSLVVSSAANHGNTLGFLSLLP